MTFAALFVSEKRDKKKSFFMILRGSSWKLSNAKRCLATPTHMLRICVNSPPVSATPTAFASRIGQFPLSRRRRPRSLRESVNSPCLGDADRVRFANRSIPPVSATPTHMLRICVNSPCLGDADQRTACIGQFPQYTFGISPTITVSARATFAFISILKFDINVSTQTSAFISA